MDTGKLRQQYREEGWGVLAEAAGFDPVNTESATRDAFRYVCKELPNNCDGKEQYAFEAWAKAQGFDMHEHPLHYLFLDPKTNAAREAWNECIRYCRRAVGVSK